jgi:hypothetical protein
MNVSGVEEFVRALVELEVQASKMLIAVDIGQAATDFKVVFGRWQHLFAHPIGAGLQDLQDLLSHECMALLEAHAHADAGRMADHARRLTDMINGALPQI